MPKLSYPKITKGNAITALLKLYGEEPDFKKECSSIRKPYIPILSKFARDSLVFFKSGGISPAEYYQAVIDYNKGKTKKEPFATEKFSYLSDLQPYFDRLGKLAYKWKLRAPWALLVLFLLDLMDLLKAEGIPTEVDIPLGDLEFIYPWEPPLPPLEIKVPAWAIIIGGRQAVQAEINRKLEEYENNLKEKGLHEYPSALDQHARWWFEHYVRGKKYRELDKGYPSPNAESIKRAVWKFTRFVGIKVK